MYDLFSVDYDRFVNWENRLAYEMPFIRKLLQTRDKKSGQVSILDSACGSGMHVLALAKEGYSVSGADFSQGMIRKAQKNAEQAGLQIEFKNAGFGEMTEIFEGSEVFPFHSILCLGNSLPHVLDEAALGRTLQDMVTCLQPGGMLLIQNRNFDGVMQQKERWMQPQSYREGDQEWIFNRFYDFEPDGLITFNMQVLHRGEPGDTWQQQVMSSQLRPWTQADLVKALQSAGFKEVISYGNMEGDPFLAGESPNLIVCCRK